MTDQHFKPYPKAQKKRKRQNRDAWQILRERVLKLDRVCVVCTVRPSESVHHVVPKDYSGDDVAMNLIGVCGSGTTRCHGLIEARDLFACNRVRQVLESHKPGVLQYVLDTVGRAWFDDRYPPLDGADAAGSVEREADRAPARGGERDSRSNFWGKPCPRWGSPGELDVLFNECLLILKNMDAPVVKKGGGEAYSVLQLVFTDFRDRWREHLRGAA